VTAAPFTPAVRPAPAKAVALLALVGLFAYYNSLHGAFVLDDSRFVADPNVGRPFASSMAPRPVIAVSLSVNYWLDGLNPRGYHAANLLVHVLAAVVLYDLVRRTLALPRFGGRYGAWAGWVGLVAALVWMVHPLQTQSVTYVIQRCESMMGLFFLLALWCVLRGATADRHSVWWNAAAVASCAVATGCKEMTVALPPLVLIYDRAFLSDSWRRAVRARWKVCAALAVPPAVEAAYLIFSGFLTDDAGTVGLGVKVYTPYTYLLTQAGVLFHYLRLAVWPVGLTLDYLDWPPCRSLADCWPQGSAILALLAATGWGVARGTAWGFLGAWFFLILAPTSSFVPIQDAVFEHRMYLPLAAVVLLVVCGAAECGRAAGGRRVGPALGGAAAVVVVVLAMLTVVRNEDYSSPARLYAADAAERPANGGARLNLAVQLFAAGDVAAADAELEAAMALPLRLPNLRIERVRVLRESGRAAEAVALSRELVAENPASVETGFEFGLCLLADGRPAEAEPYFRRMAEKSPADKFARAHLGIALLATGRPADADAEFREAHRLDPEYAALLNKTSRRTATDPDAKPANLRLVAWFAAAACRMAPAAPADYHDTHAVCLARIGRYPAAVAESGLAADLARAAGDAYLASRIDARTARYRAGKPYLPEAEPAGGKP